MATIVCQGLQSCLEPQLVEPRTLRLKLSSPRPHFSQPLELASKSCFSDSNSGKELLGEKCQYEEFDKKTDSLNDNDNRISSNPDLGGWTFLQSLSNSSQSSKEEMETFDNYVHPLYKHSSSTLSEKSLELCTESLGSETGSDIIEDSIFSLSPSENSQGGKSPTRVLQKSRQLFGARKVNSANFPPPLTTISGAESLQVRPHREDGRLIITAVKVPSRHNIFQAERSHGRLRLRFFQDSVSTFDSESEVGTDENEGRNEYNTEEEIKIENKENCDDQEMELEDEEDDLEIEEEDDEENDGVCLEEEMNGNISQVEGKIGMKKYARPGRCKEGELDNKGLLNWEAFLVATS